MGFIGIAGIAGVAIAGALSGAVLVAAASLGSLVGGVFGSCGSFDIAGGERITKYSDTRAIRRVATHQVRIAP